MSKKNNRYVCNNCGNILQKWTGQCPDCFAWNTIEEETTTITTNYKIPEGKKLEAENLNSPLSREPRINSAYKEFDRVLGGGITEGSAILIGGEPGIGKSTLLLQLVTTLNEDEISCLYVTGEESADQVKLRAKRLNSITTNSSLIAATNLEDILTTLKSEKQKPKLLVIDSIQTIYTRTINSAPGTVSQIRTCSNELISFCKTNNIILFLVGHVTKEGQIAGPKLLEHMVDTVLYFEGDSGGSYRLIRSVKNRYGATGEIAVFNMQDTGLKEITNPSELFLMNRKNNVSGVATFATIEGTRPLLVEIQALVAPSHMPTPRRSVVGWDNNRLSMILAVLNVRYGLNLTNYEVYLSIAGGYKITEPAADLAVCCALLSSAMNIPLATDSVIFGEVGLSGEIRPVNNTHARIKEAAKLGFNKLYIPKADKTENLECYFISHIKQLRDLFTKS